MILLVALILVLVSVPLTGGRLSRLGEVQFERTGLVVMAVAVQLVLVYVVASALPDAVAGAVHLGSYALAGAFVWHNRHVPGLALLAIGGAANLAAIAANAGVMPASPSALRSAGLAMHTSGFQNSAAVSGARLQFLGDVFAVPAGWPMANVFSIGDVLLVVGTAMLVHRACRAPRLTTAS